MTQVSVTLNGRTYRLRCGVGEEERLVALANEVKGRFDALLGEHGNVGDDRLLLMTALKIADELFDARVSRDLAVADQAAAEALAHEAAAAAERAAQTLADQIAATATAKPPRKGAA